MPSISIGVGEKNALKYVISSVLKTFSIYDENNGKTT